MSEISMQAFIEPHHGAGPVRFGMLQAEVRKVLGGAVEPLANKSDTAVPADYFVALGLLVYYTDSGACEALEFNGPMSPEFEGRCFLGQRYGDAEQTLRALDPDIETDDAGLTSRRLGLGLYAPSARKAPAQPVKSVIVFAPGYFDA